MHSWSLFSSEIFELTRVPPFGICKKAILAISFCGCTVFFMNGKAFDIVYKMTGQPLFRPPYTSLHLPVHSQ